MSYPLTLKKVSLSNRTWTVLDYKYVVLYNSDVIVEFYEFGELPLSGKYRANTINSIYSKV